MDKYFDISLEIACPDWAGYLEEAHFSEELSQFLTQNVARLQPVDPEIRVWRLAEEIEISLVLSDDANVRLLNKTYRDQDKATNVLSFTQLDDLDVYPDEALREISLGDIIIAYQTILQEADMQQKTVQDHLKHMVLHGVLHLLGYDHISEEDANIMESREIALLADWGVANPYETDQL